MAQYRATIKGTRGEASRLGHKTQGITAYVNGWNTGVRVEAHYDEATGRDMFDIYMTGGSRGVRPQQMVGRVIGENFTINKAVQS